MSQADFSSTCDPSQSRLCDVCDGLQLSPRRFVISPGDSETVYKPDHPDNFIHLGTLENIRIKTNCPFCRLINVALGPQFPASDPQDGELMRVAICWSMEGPIPNYEEPWNITPVVQVIHIYCMPKQNGQVLLSDHLNREPVITLLAEDSPIPSTDFMVRRVNPDKIDLDLVQSWITLCRTEHGDYCKQAKILEYELRHPSEVLSSFRLIDTEQNCLVRDVGAVEYTTLSYVWGGFDSLRTLEENVFELEQAGTLLLPKYLSRIPQTIRDAMQVVHDLGLRYLWVDSLCIVQDSQTEEKATMISRMDLVYGSAFLVIIASEGRDSDAGLPGLRPGTRGWQQPIEAIGPNFRLAYKHSGHEFSKRSTQVTRAWCFQEDLFARRMLIFAGGQAHFACGRHIRSPFSWREDVCMQDYEPARFSPASANILDFSSSLGSYNCRDLTYESDIYNAFAGAARWYSESFAGRLCHGVPESFFDFFLFGRLLPSVLPKRRELTPSWSWLGFKGTGPPFVLEQHGFHMEKVSERFRERTWIAWYHRKANHSDACRPIETLNQRDRGRDIEVRFGLREVQTIPSSRVLLDGPKYEQDISNPEPGSGVLQFWTVCVTFQVASSKSFPMPTPDKPQVPLPPEVTPIAIYGKSGNELTFGLLPSEWAGKNIPGEYEFALLCETVMPRRPDEVSRQMATPSSEDEDPWQYQMILLGYHGQWAEQVGVFLIDKKHLHEGLGQGYYWKEIMLG